MKAQISSAAKKIIENNPVALSTITPEGLPNVIGVAAVKVLNLYQILITDVFMNQTLKDIKNNPNVAVVAWNSDMTGYKLIGKATYYSSGDYLKQVQLVPENKDLKPKGAIVVSISKIIKSS